MPHSLGSHSNSVDDGDYFASVAVGGRLLPAASRWNSIELMDYNLFPQSQLPTGYDSLHSRFSKSYDFNLTITNKNYFKRFIFVMSSIFLLFAFLLLLFHFLPHKHHHHASSNNLTLAVSQALLFFDAQKSGNLPENKLINFRGDSGLRDGNSGDINADLVGGYYDSGNNMKFSFPTAYSISLLSWTVIEYHEKYEEIDELDHVMDIIRWGTDYLLKIFVPPNSTTDPTILYSQVGTGNGTNIENDMNCWERPEDMSYERPVSVCGATASDLAGETIAALSAAALVFKNDSDYSKRLINSAEKLFEVSTKSTPINQQGMYTADEICGGAARQFYNSSGYKDELVWGGIWLFFATGNNTYLQYATNNFESSADEELLSEKGVFYWNNKFSANAILLTRLRFFRDLGYPYESAFESSTNSTDLLMCSYLSNVVFNMTEGGLILLKPEYGAPLQYAATASFISKLYTDFLDLLRRSGTSCGSSSFTLQNLRAFSHSQVNYILGDNPMKMSYLVGYGDQYPTQVHHRAASIPWDNQKYSCDGGQRWLNSKDPNPNLLVGAMVGGPGLNDIFLDQRDKPWFTEPTLASNAGLVAALISLHDPPKDSSSGSNGLDKMGIFQNVHLIPSPN